MGPRAAPYNGSQSVSIVIPTSRAGADLDACLESIAAQDHEGVEIIVVDNATGDPALAQLPDRFTDLRVLRNAVNRGFVGACNQGIDVARGDLVLLLNDDTTLEYGALTALADALRRNPGWGACQAKLLRMDDPTRLDTAGSFLTATGFLVHRGSFAPESQFSEEDEVFAAKGAALLVRRIALEQVGRFDPDFFAYFEETDLCWRLWLAGWSVGFAADARVLHKLGATASSLPSAFVQFHSYKNRLCTIVKNAGPRTLATMVPLHVALCGGLGVWYAVRGQPAVGGAIVRALAWNAAQLPRTLRKRRAVQRTRRVPDEELMPRITTRSDARTFLRYARGRPG